MRVKHNTTKMEILLVIRDAFLFLNQGLDVMDGVRSLHFKNNLSQPFLCQYIYTDMHGLTDSHFKAKRRIFLDIVM